MDPDDETGDETDGEADDGAEEDPIQACGRTGPGRARSAVPPSPLGDWGLPRRADSARVDPSVLTLLTVSLLAIPGSPTSTSPPDAGIDTAADFVEDVRLLTSVVACREPVPAEAQLDAAAIEAFCAVQKPRYERFRDRWTPTARAFFAEVLPAGLPSELVYPFGGGDLMTALATFPEASTITTLSLELAGDPRRLAGLRDGKALKESLLAIATASASTLMSNDSLSRNLSKTQRGELPGQLSMHLMGLAMFDFEPVSVRYFRVEPDGRLHYYTMAEVQALDGQRAASLKREWRSPDFSPAFANVEVQYVQRGQPSATRRVHRHIAVNLSDEGLAGTPGVLRHLEAKGRATMMTKAASYLLWNEHFSRARDYLTSHAVFMVSDSTGPPPHFWRRAGCTLTTFGAFRKSFLGTWEGYQEELRTEFASAGRVPMRYGYPDGSPEKLSHLLIARCAGASGALAAPRRGGTGGAP